MKMNYAWLFFILLLTTSLAYAQPNKVKIVTSPGGKGTIVTKTTLPVRLEWISPRISNSQGEIITLYKKINIEVRAYTEAVLKDGDFSVLIDGKPPIKKSGEQPLRVNKPKQEYIYRCIIDLPIDSRNHSIQVQCNNNGVLERTKTLIVKSSSKPPPISITWKFPDVIELRDRVYLHTEPYLEVAANIETGGTALELSQINIKYNDVEYKPNETNASLVSNGSRYSFRYKQPILNSMDIQSISIIVEGIESDKLNLRYSSTKKPRLYILSVGTQTNLTYTVQDAIDFANLFQSQQTGNSLYSEINVEKLLKERASTQEIRKAINRLSSKMNTSEIDPNDLVLLFISTHGFILDNDFRLQGDDYSSDTPYATSISFDEDIMRVIRNMDCKKLIFLDACHSVSAFDPGNGSKASPEAVERALEKYNEFRIGTAILASSQGNELSYEHNNWKNGAFTEGIIRGLKNREADFDNNKIITLNELSKYVEKKVPELVKAVKGAGISQRPKLYDPDQIKELPIYVIQVGNN